MSVDMTKYTPLLASFLCGVVATLILTGSIKTHFEPTTSPSPYPVPLPYPKPLELEDAKYPQPAPVLELGLLENTSDQTPPNDITPPLAIVSKPSSNNTVGLAATFKEMLVERSGDFQVIEDNVTIEEAREQAYAALVNMKSIQQGNGSHSVYVLFDPLCPHCHTLYKKMAGGWADTLDLTVNWIPAIALLDNDKSVLISQRFITALNADKQLLSSAALAALVDGDYSLVLSDDWLTTDQSFLDLAKNTMALIQIGGGTPAVIFKTASGDFEIINGVPTLDDFSVLTND